MTLDIELGRAIASPQARLKLVQAIVAAPRDEPETDYVEWKSGTDLKPARAVIAKNILGFANRDVSRAARHLEGTAYLVVGVSPGELSGITPADPAQLVDWISPFLGHGDAPQWDPHYVRVNDLDVLVVSVPAPRLGDRPWPCRKTHDETAESKTRPVTRDGAIYIRRGGQTVEATSSEQDMLERRMRHTKPIAISVSPRPNPATSIRAVDDSPDSVGEWVDREERRLLDALESATRPKEANPSSKPYELDAARLLARQAADMRRQLDQLAGSTTRPDPRTADQYQSEVSDYTSKLRTMLPAYLRWKAAAELNLAPLQLEVVNSTDDNLLAVEVHVHVMSSVVGFD